MGCIWIVHSKHRWQKPGISGFLYCLTGMRVVSIYLWKITVTFLANTTGTGRPAHENARGTLHSPGLFRSLGRTGSICPVTGGQVWGLHIHSAIWTVNSPVRQMPLIHHLQRTVWTCPQTSTVTTALLCPMPYTKFDVQNTEDVAISVPKMFSPLCSHLPWAVYELRLLSHERLWHRMDMIFTFLLVSE